MKKLMLSLVASLALWQANAAEEGWTTDFPKAQAQAKEEKRMVLMDFTGSDWCPPCKQLHKRVLSTAEFKEYAKKNLVLVELDFPNSKPQSAELKKANRALSKKFDVEGYPTIILLSPDGKELFRDVGYDGSSPKAFIAKLEKHKADK